MQYSCHSGKRSDGVIDKWFISYQTREKYTFQTIGTFIATTYQEKWNGKMIYVLRIETKNNGLLISPGIVYLSTVCTCESFSFILFITNRYQEGKGIPMFFTSRIMGKGV